MEDTNKGYKPLFLNSFWIKILAILLMTLDHLFFCFEAFGQMTNADTIYIVMRTIGRLAYPLFCFMIVEGVLHTKSFGRYMLRLGTCASIVSLAILAVEYLPIFKGFTIRKEGVIYLDLLLGALAIYCLKDKRWYIKILSLLPLAYGVASTFASGLECVTCGTEIWFVPFFMRTQYEFLGILMMILIYLGYVVSDYFLSKFNGVYDGTVTQRVSRNIGMILGIIIASSIFYIFQINQTEMFSLYLIGSPDVQLLSSFACIILIFYNGKLGYHKTWFQYSTYAYYMVHTIILYLVFMLIFG